MNIKFKIPRATPPQIQHIEQLLIDVGLLERQKRNAHLELFLGHPIKFLDELTIGEASNVIDDLKRIKESASEARKNKRWKNSDDE